MTGVYHVFKFVEATVQSAVDLAALAPQLLVAAVRTVPWLEQALRDVLAFAV